MSNLDDERVSKFQRQIYNLIKEAYPSFSIELEKYIPETNQRIDIYIENLTLAIECDGIQHFKPVGFYVKTIEQWDKMIKADKTKDKILKNAGITVLRIPYNHKLKSAEDIKILFNSLNYNEKEYDPNIFIDVFKEEVKEQNKKILSERFKNNYQNYKPNYKNQYSNNKPNYKEQYKKYKELKNKRNLND